MCCRVLAADSGPGSVRGGPFESDATSLVVTSVAHELETTLNPLQQWLSEIQDEADPRESPSCESADDRVRSSPQRPAGLCVRDDGVQTPSAEAPRAPRAHSLGVHAADDAVSPPWTMVIAC